MCTFQNKSNVGLPKGKKVKVWKVFGYGVKGMGDQRSRIPHDFCGHTPFSFGENIWDKAKAKTDENGQSGFQVFRYKRDAVKAAWEEDKICPVTIDANDIIKATDEFPINTILAYKGRGSKCLTVFEVDKFHINENDWNTF